MLGKSKAPSKQQGYCASQHLTCKWRDCTLSAGMLGDLSERCQGIQAPCPLMSLGPCIPRSRWRHSAGKAWLPKGGWRIMGSCYTIAYISFLDTVQSEPQPASDKHRDGTLAKAAEPVMLRSWHHVNWGESVVAYSRSRDPYVNITWL